MYFFSFKFLPLILLFQRSCSFFVVVCLFFDFIFGVFLTVVKIMHFRVCMLVHSLSYQSRKRRLVIRKAVRN